MAQTTKELLQARYAEVERGIETIEARSAPLRKQREALQAKVSPIEDEMRKLHEQIKEAEQPTLSELKMELSALAKALGAKSMKAEGGTTKAAGA